MKKPARFSLKRGWLLSSEDACICDMAEAGFKKIAVPDS